jgi:hypothetical protein
MGRLLNKLKKLEFPIEKIESQLKEALKNRNFLAHHYFFERAIAITTDEGCTKMVNELIGFQSFFKTLEKEIQLVTDKMSLRYGFTKELRESMMEQMQSEYKNNL